MSDWGCSKKSPLYFVLLSVLFIVLPISPSFVLPSVSEAPLTSFGTASWDVIPRRVSAEGPLASLGVTFSTVSCRAIARHPSLLSGRRPQGRNPSGWQPPTVSSQGMLFFLSFRGTQVPRDPSLRSGRQKRHLGAT
jgi:hypothetical protein